MYRTNVLNHFPSLIIDHTCTETKIFEHTLTSPAERCNLVGVKHEKVQTFSSVSHLWQRSGVL